MPHVLVNLRPGTSEAQKGRLAERIAQDVTDVLNYGDESVSDALEEITERDGEEKVGEPDILSRPEKPHKKPGYTM